MLGLSRLCDRALVCTCGLAGLALAAHWWGVGRIQGRSMQPALNPDHPNGMRRDLVLLYTPDKGGLARSLRRGDVVFLRAPHDPRLVLVKRVQALPGDVVAPRAGHGAPHEPQPVTVPRGHVWVESDESFRGLDSNAFGAVPMGLVGARVRWLLWPRWGPVPARPMAPGRLRVAESTAAGADSDPRISAAAAAVAMGG